MKTSDKPAARSPRRHRKTPLKLIVVWCGSLIVFFVPAAISDWLLWLSVPCGLAMTVWAYMIIFRLHEEREKDRGTIEATFPPGIEPGEAPRPSTPTAPPTPLAELDGPGSAARSLAVSSDGRLLAIGHDTRTIRLWDISEPHHAVPVAGITHNGVVAVVAFHPRTQLLATGGTDGTVMFWNITDPSRPAEISTLDCRSGPLSTVHTVAFNPNGQSMATGGRDGTVTVWDIRKPIAPVPIATVRYGKRPSKRRPSGPYSMRYSPDGRILTIGGYNDSYKIVELWDVTNPKNPTHVTSLNPHSPGTATSHTTAAHAVDHSPDGRLIAVASTHDYSVTTNYIMSPDLHNSAVTIWSILDPLSPKMLAVLEQRGGYGVTFAKPRSQRQRRKHPAITLSGHTAPARTLAFTPDGRHLITGGDDATVLVWDIRDPARPRHLRTLPHAGRVRQVVISPNGTTITCCDENPNVLLW